MELSALYLDVGDAIAGDVFHVQEVGDDEGEQVGGHQRRPGVHVRHVPVTAASNTVNIIYRQYISQA